MNPRVLLLVASTISATGAFAQVEMDAGALAKFARDTGMPAKAILVGPAADYLHQTFKTQATIYAEASVVRKIDDRCNRIKLVLKMPDFVVTVKNPANPAEEKTGPFETTTEMNLCS